MLLLVDLFTFTLNSFYNHKTMYMFLIQRNWLYAFLILKIIITSKRRRKHIQLKYSLKYHILYNLFFSFLNYQKCIGFIFRQTTVFSWHGVLLLYWLVPHISCSLWACGEVNYRGRNRRASGTCCDQLHTDRNNLIKRVVVSRCNLLVYY